MAPIVAALCGKEPKMVNFMIQNLAPRVQIVHACTTADAALNELPALLRGEAVKPSSGLGTNVEADSPRTDIAILMVGAGYTPDELAAIKAATDAVKLLPIFAADKSKTVGPGPPTPAVVRERILGSLESEATGEDQWEAGIYMF